MPIDFQTTNSVVMLDLKSSDAPHIMTGEKSGDSIVNLAQIDDTSSEASHTTGEVKISPNDLVLSGGSLIDEHPSQTVPPARKVSEVSHLILEIIFEYALNKFDDSKDRLAAGAAKFLPVIDQFVTAGTRVETCLPAFPFKSANKVYKVLGPLPDKAEELALERLNSMCTRIRDVYPPGAKVTIISDGTTYNGASDTNSDLSLTNFA